MDLSPSLLLPVIDVSFGSAIAGGRGGYAGLTDVKRSDSGN